MNQIYERPEITLISILSENIVCQSGDIEDMPEIELMNYWILEHTNYE